MFSGFDRDDAMLRDIHHPGHTDGGREGFATFAALCLAGTVTFSAVEIAWLPLYWKIFVTLFVAAVGGIVVGAWIRGLQTSAKRKAQNAYRAMREAETQKGIDQMLRAQSKIPRVRK
ncbi:hypothetical protein FIU89_10410 [Roseovarius sp. THAF27]|uniref:hypothetical protein n=1 Tax=Roseovarius sp. THAF27 TaxID=2587850 RepID=UPI00126943ED|nr:hypothetical protein [Roseovarius sp. THAF27]QFT81022.1 hypothetical protein FIU89_10410 [Roseovarius sp. THAF27]